MRDKLLEATELLERFTNAMRFYWEDTYNNVLPDLNLVYEVENFIEEIKRQK